MQDQNTEAKWNLEIINLIFVIFQNSTQCFG